MAEDVTPEDRELADLCADILFRHHGIITSSGTTWARELREAGYVKVGDPDVVEGFVVLNNKGVEFGQITDQETAEKVRDAYQRMIDTETLRVAAVVPVTP